MQNHSKMCFCFYIYQQLLENIGRVRYVTCDQVSIYIFFLEDKGNILRLTSGINKKKTRQKSLCTSLIRFDSLKLAEYIK